MRTAFLLFVLSLSHLEASSLYSAAGSQVIPAGGSAISGCSVESFAGNPLSIAPCSFYSNFTSEGTAATTFTSIRASSSASLSGASATAGDFFVASGYGRIIDKLDVSNLPGGDTISVLFHFAGFGINNGMNFAGGRLSFGFDYGNPLGPGNGFQASWNKPFVNDVYIATPAIPVSLFQNYSFFLSLSAQEFFTAPSTGIVTVSGSSDFAHTLEIAAITPRDANGNFVNAVLPSESGTVYNVSANSPEPASLLLAGSALACLILVRQRRRVRFYLRPRLSSNS